MYGSPFLNGLKRGDNMYCIVSDGMILTKEIRFASECLESNILTFKTIEDAKGLSLQSNQTLCMILPITSLVHGYVSYGNKKDYRKVYSVTGYNTYSKQSLLDKIVKEYADKIKEWDKNELDKELETKLSNLEKSRVIKHKDVDYYINKEILELKKSYDKYHEQSFGHLKDFDDMYLPLIETIKALED